MQILAKWMLYLLPKKKIIRTMQTSSYLTNNFGLLSDVNKRFVMIVSTKCGGAKDNSLIKTEFSPKGLFELMKWLE